jgi:hypothetical protein
VIRGGERARRTCTSTPRHTPRWPRARGSSARFRDRWRSDLRGRFRRG